MKRIATLLMALVLCLGLTIPVSAAETYDFYDCNYLIIDPDTGDRITGLLECDAAYADENAVVGGEPATIITVKPGSNIFTFPSWFTYEPGELVTDENGTYFSAYGIMGGPAGCVDDLGWEGCSALRMDMIAETIIIVKGKTEATEAAPAQPANPFTDVANDAYYYDAVLWALENKITTGVTATEFQPTATCTRGQVATFLWRAKGCPEPQTTVNPFTDVAASSPFYKAILWAYENGITTGATDTTFNPSGTCSSAHVVTFLWRAEGKPAASGDSALAAANPGAYYTDAVAWADSSDLLSGTGSAFAPNAKSPRADIVTYLYRNLAQ